MKTSYIFLVIGKTTESKEAGESFKRYIGLASSKVLAVNPDKKELDELMGFESQADPEYVVDTDNGKEVRINFIVRTDPEVNNGIEITNRLMFTLRNTPAYNRDKTKVQVIDTYGNSSWVDAEAAKAGVQLPCTAKIDQSNYRIAAYGEADLVDFLKKYLGVPSSLDYVNGAWTIKANAADGKFGLEHIKDYFSGNFSELKEALKLQPNNKVKLLYGVRTSEEGKQYQAIASRGELILRNNAGSSAIARMEKDLISLKAAGSYPTTEFKVAELQEYTVEATNLEKPVEDTSSEMPWD